MLRKFFLFVCLSFILILIAYAINSVILQNSLANKVLRLHILANSNSTFDQELKLEVRDKVIEFLAPKIENSQSLSETKEIIKNNLQDILSVAQDTASKKSNYKVSVSLDTSTFPTKYYEDFSFPAGKYEALKILIGEGNGNNWWCVMFPPLCFTNSSAGIFDDNAQKTLENNLTSSELEFIESKKADVKIKFRLLELWNS